MTRRRRLGALLFHLLTGTSALLGPSLIIPRGLLIDSAQRLVIQTMGAGLILALGFGVGFSRRARRVFPLAALAAWLLLTSALGDWSGQSLMALGPLLVAMLWAGVIILGDLPSRWPLRWWNLAVVGCLVSAATAWLLPREWFNLDPDHTRLGYVSSFGNPLALGGALCLAAVIAGAACLRATTLNARLTWALMLGVLVITLLATGSRGPLLAFLVGIAAVILMGHRARPRTWGIIAAVLIVGTVLHFALGPRSPAARMVQRVGETFDRSSESTQHRLRLWEIAGGLIAEHPVTGHGWRTYGLSFQEELWQRLNGPNPERWQAEALLLGDRVPRHAHSDHLEFAVSGGVPALLLLWLVSAVALRAAWLKGPGFAQAAALGVIVAMLMLALVDFPFQRPYHAWLYFVAVGVSQRSET